MQTPSLLRILAGIAAALTFSTAAAQAPAAGNGTCASPPAASCARTGCGREELAVMGNTTEPQTRGGFFLDYPCDLQPGEKLHFILSLHGAGSIGNWQRHYFPALDYRAKYRLVIATPSAGVSDPIRLWTPSDDEYLRNIVELVLNRFGRENIASFWLAGHSQGGLTANRLVCSDYFRDKVDGWLSLSGGRIGPVEIPADFFGSGGPPANLDSGGIGARPGRAAMPDCDFSHIFTSGELEMVELPDSSPWAETYACGSRVRGTDIVDTEKGYVESLSSGRPASWGRTARPGTAQVYTYADCEGGRLVADVIRLDKGHTEGLEPRVTEHLIQMMTSAPGGKLNRQAGAE